MEKLEVDVAIVGAGVAGLWMANLLLRRGIDVAVCEGGKPGGGQTGASQGIIHGGLKYALHGVETPASRSLAAMPARWRRCLSGQGDIDLRGTEVATQPMHLWHPRDLGGRFAALLRGKLRSGQVCAVAPSEHPEPFRGLSGRLYRLDDFAIDVQALCRQLAAPLQGRLVRMQVGASNVVRRGEAIRALRNDAVAVYARRFVFAAGAGNAALAQAAGFCAPMQRRPLRQVLVHGLGLHPVFVHCLRGAEAVPALTVTTRAGGYVLGGELAEAGASRSQAEQVAAARRALRQCFPQTDWQAHHFETLRVDRAEPAQPDAGRPAGPHLAAHGNALVAWPVKLALAPSLGDMAVQALCT